MIDIRNNSNKLVVVVHEIYGVNEHMNYVCDVLSKKSFDVICPNLLERERPYDYALEEVAYRHFMENIGFTNAVNKVKRVLQDVKGNYKQVFIVGYSVGATIAWLCSEEKEVHGVVGHYGSRIRNYHKINPLCPTMLIFPEYEESFNVDELISFLVEKNIDLHKMKGKHGFSDPYNSKYNPKSAFESFNLMIDFLNRVD